MHTRPETQPLLSDPSDSDDQFEFNGDFIEQSCPVAAIADSIKSSLASLDSEDSDLDSKHASEYSAIEVSSESISDAGSLEHDEYKDYFLLKTQLLHGLLDECLDCIKSKEKRFRFQKINLPTLGSMSLLLGGILVLLAGASAGASLASGFFTAREKRVSTIDSQIKEAYTTASTSYYDKQKNILTCRDAGASFESRSSEASKANHFVNTCIRSKKDSEDLRVSWMGGPVYDWFGRGGYWERQLIADECRGILLTLCSEYNKAISDANMPWFWPSLICIPFSILIAGVCIYSAIKSHPKSYKVTLSDLDITVAETMRINAVLSVFNDLNINPEDEAILLQTSPLSAVKGAFINIKNELSRLERDYFTDQLLCQEIGKGGRHKFFSEMRKMVTPEQLKITPDMVENIFSKAQEANLFSR